MDKCKVSGRCGGCNYQGIEYARQLLLKQKNEEKLLSQFGPVLPVVGMDMPLYYRNKVHHALAADKKGRIISGSYEEGSHKVVSADDCMLEDVKSREIIRAVCTLLPSFRIPVWDEDRQTGLMRHILVRRGFTSGEIMVVLVTASPVFPSRNNFTKALVKAHPEITTVVQNINGKRTGMVLGDRSQTLYGPGFIKDRLCGLTFRISADSFYQINPVQTEKLYSAAVEYAGLTGKETVIDAYCGTGTIGLIAASGAENVIGVELSASAVRDAVANAAANCIENARFFRDDAGRFMNAMAAEGRRADVVFMDPPRSGSTEQFMASAVRLGPSRIVYVSCEPVTLARDLKYLTRRGYRAEKILPVDMFPFTEKTESVVLLIREQD